ncbi:hypothetical protein CALVIDRAFT_559282 [Calocera viscosa TUFC12733]|uniref:T6SS Phospholipase effector Tle1-like catalytic domain-containing protein n=1 Tax=Calocera viscosa (strain TUFC12733) TaxID=1330018 RepID=A0A167S0Q9_CALVF|nr:hypothetical protein CALVIDRAFT_559282 [Calocera viscosa TUFC12733]
MADDANPLDGHRELRGGRVLVLCFDGTSDLFDRGTNAVQLMSFLKTDDYTRQMVYYQSGVGTYLRPNMLMPIVRTVLKLLDDAFAWDLDDHVMGGYRFLMQNWLPGDRIMLFGFSRGAYTARALAGMLEKVGLLPRGNNEQVPYAYKMYKRIDSEGWTESDAFKKTMSTPVHVDFVGVWDTVSSVGFMMNEYLPFTASNYHIRVFRHAVALDEHRCMYRPNMWHYTVPPFEAPPPASLETGKEPGALKRPTDIQEVWFAGCHGDVGGGNPPDKNGALMARIPLLWMIREAVLTKTGILWNELALQQAGFKLPMPAPEDTIKMQRQNGATDPDGPVQNYISALDAHYEQDVSASIHDKLNMNKLWWILEIIPLKYRRQQKNGQWRSYFGPHLGRPRHIPDPPPPTNVHVSVAQRMSKVKYKPRAKWEGEPNWVE